MAGEQREREREQNRERNKGRGEGGGEGGGGCPVDRKRLRFLLQVWETSTTGQGFLTSPPPPPPGRRRRKTTFLKQEASPSCLLLRTANALFASSHEDDDVNASDIAISCKFFGFCSLVWLNEVLKYSLISSDAHYHTNRVFF